MEQTAARLADQWRLTLGRAYTGGSHSLVRAATRAGGSPAVLKVPLIIDDENREEAEALRCYGGDGAVRVFEYDRASGALLLERAAPGTWLSDHPNREEAISVVCGLLRRLRRPVPPGHPFPLVRAVADRWSDQIDAATWLPRGVAREAAAFARSGWDRRPELLVNRDAHLGNVLAAQREPWLLIDPKPLVGPPAFDAGYLLHDLLGDRPTAAAARRLVTRLAVELGVEPAEVRGWGLLRAVENAVWARARAKTRRPTSRSQRCLRRGRGGSGRPW